ncbi:MAG: hypothetical protein ACREJR_04615, partial [Candidatus Rokuibacteriota bacterium]
MHSRPERFGGAAPGDRLGPLTFTVSAEANERYWAAAGVDHPSLRAGALYPPIAANLTILLFQTVATRPLLHTAQQLTCHRRGEAGAELTVEGSIVERYEKRGREPRLNRSSQHCRFQAECRRRSRASAGVFHRRVLRGRVLR